jgi:hypothetical protein
MRLAGKYARLAAAALFLTAGSSLPAQEQPPAHDMHHMHHGGFMQGGMHHAVAKGVKLDQQVDATSHTITLRVGPINLPANTNHRNMPQPADMTWTIPIDGWLLAYTPRLVDGNSEVVPGKVLHHVAFWNTSRSDFLCPNKEEHIFGAGSELTNWAEMPGYGYRVQKGDKIRIETMVHNPWETPYSNVYLEVKIPYTDSGDSAATAKIKSVYPAWMDVESCRDSGYDLKAGKSETIGSVKVKYDGVLLGVGGHLHDYGRQLVLQDTTRNETVVTLDAKVNENGELLSIPVVTFFDKGGYKLASGDELKITATYDNTTGKLLPDGAMGIVVGYFVPTDDTAMAGLRRRPKSAARQVAAVSHD